MADEIRPAEEGRPRGEKVRMKGSGASEAVYGLGLLGALLYFLQHAHGFWSVVLGIGEALVWPAVLVYKMLEFLKM